MLHYHENVRIQETISVINILSKDIIFTSKWYILRVCINELNIARTFVPHTCVGKQAISCPDYGFSSLARWVQLRLWYRNQQVFNMNLLDQNMLPFKALFHLHQFFCACCPWGCEATNNECLLTQRTESFQEQARPPAVGTRTGVNIDVRPKKKGLVLPSNH